MTEITSRATAPWQGQNMIRRVRQLLAAVAAMFAVAAACVAWADSGTADAAASKLLAPGLAAETFRLPVYNEAAWGKMVGLDNFVGAAATTKSKVLVVTFFQSDCKACKRELPDLNKLYGEWKEKGLAVVAIAIDRDPAGQKIVEQIVADNKLNFPVLKDRFQIVARKYKVEDLPTTYYLDNNGIIRYAHSRYEQDGFERMKKELGGLLGIQ